MVVYGPMSLQPNGVTPVTPWAKAVAWVSGVRLSLVGNGPGWTPTTPVLTPEDGSDHLDHHTR